MNKSCKTEQQRQAYLIGLAHVAPPRLEGRDREGMIRRVAERLGVARGKRSKKRGARPYAFEKAIDRRAEFDAAVAKLEEPLQVGELVLTYNGPAELTRFVDGGGCVVTYRVGDAYGEKSYAKCYGKEAGSARLQRIPPSLLPSPRATSSLSTPNSTRKAVLDHAYEYCKESPHQRDVVSRRVGPFATESKPGLILEDVRDEPQIDRDTRRRCEGT